MTRILVYLENLCLNDFIWQARSYNINWQLKQLMLSDFYTFKHYAAVILQRDLHSNVGKIKIKFFKTDSPWMVVGGPARPSPIPSSEATAGKFPPSVCL